MQMPHPIVCYRVAWWPSDWYAGLAINRSRVQITVSLLSSTTPGKLLTHVPLSPSSIIWVPANGRWCGMPCGCEGNRRSGIALATCHRH